MVTRVNLDAMIPRDDFAVEADEFALDLFADFPITSLTRDSAILKLLRKPDFQRETNHWSIDQLATFVASFLDNEVIPSLILWKSPSFIFVIDGGHRLSALRAWMEDDYGDGSISQAFYSGEIPVSQKRSARRARTIVENRVGRFSALRDLVGSKTGDEASRRRANRLATRAIPVQWIQGSADVAETSFFKINTQGTPLDDTEAMLIRNRRKPVAISARAILRAGAGHKYWSSFSQDAANEIETLASEIYELMFQPDIEEPLKTLDIPVGGSVSPVDALAILVDFLSIASRPDGKVKSISEDEEDQTGEATISVLRNSKEIIKRITGNSPESLGLHPAIYFYNERGKYSRFLFLAMTLLLTEKVRNSDKLFFRRFTRARAKLESFLMENKSLIGILVQNMGKTKRVPNLKKLLSFVISESENNREVTPESVISHLGLHGRIIDVVSAKTSTRFSNDTKSKIFISKALETTIECPICQGKLDPRKSVSYDHVVRVRDGGVGTAGNGQLVHPYCNSAMKN